MNIDVLPNAKPKTNCPYSIPLHNRQVFKDELDRLVEIGVLE